jgi:hypothetical protein
LCVIGLGDLPGLEVLVEGLDRVVEGLALDGLGRLPHGGRLRGRGAAQRSGQEEDRGEGDGHHESDRRDAGDSATPRQALEVQLDDFLGSDREALEVQIGAILGADGPPGMEAFRVECDPGVGHENRQKLHLGREGALEGEGWSEAGMR